MDVGDPLIPASRDKPAHLRECYCDTCGLIAPSWFHNTFLLHGEGFTCIWCCFSHKPELIKEPKPVGPYVNRQ